MNLIDLLWFIANIGVGGAVSIWLGHRWGWAGYVLGFPIGFVSLIFVVETIRWLDDMLYRGRPNFPVCRNGKCREGDYRYEMEEGRVVLRCQCGTEYAKNGRRFSEVLPDGSIRSYLVWRAFSGWYPDNGC